jgi:hypothetical protein
MASAFAVYSGLETDADMALGSEIADFGRPDLHQADRVGRVCHIAMVQERHIAGVRVLVEMIDTRSVERG